MKELLELFCAVLYTKSVHNY